MHVLAGRQHFCNSIYQFIPQPTSITESKLPTAS
jgi:hypothetical protein